MGGGIEAGKDGHRTMGIRQTVPLRVLVMEDQALLGFVLGEVLEELGYDVLAIAATHADAAAAARKARPDLMIVDVHLRSSSGIGAVAEICATGFVPHVFVTGDMAEANRQCLGSVAIQKPFAEADLTRAIAKALAATP